MNLNLPENKQNIDNIQDNDYCFKCGGELEVIHEVNPDVDGWSDDSWLRCVKCGQNNSGYEKEEWLKKGKK